MVERRSHTCGELRASQVGQEVVVQGWAHAVRDRGGRLFLILRDRHGTVQITVDERSPEPTREVSKAVRQEYVVQVKGTCTAREPATVNPKMDTGEIEVVASELEILSETKPLPFAVHDHGSDAHEETRLKYRYLDLRRSLLRQIAGQLSDREAEAADLPNVVFVDLHLGGASGIEFYEELVDRFPDRAGKVVFLSGSFGEADLAYLERRNLPWVRKPFGAEELRDMVAEFMGNR